MIVSVIVIVIGGANWATTADVCAQLHIDRKRLNQWVKRGKVDRPKYIRGRGWYYNLDQATDAELDTSGRAA